jgi:hypothetical protein
LLAQGGFHATTHAVFGPDVLHSPSFDNVPVVIAEPLDACTQLTNASAAAVTGNVALIERGACFYTTKVLNAQNAGAVAVIIYNNRAGTLGQMNGNNGDITIPSVFIDQAYGQALSAAIAAGAVTVSLHCGASHLNAPTMNPADTAFSIAIDVSDWMHDTNSWAANDGYVVLDLEFVFPYFSQSYDTVHVGTNGYLTFGSTHYALGRSMRMPTPGGVQGTGVHALVVDSIIAIFWADLDPSSGGSVQVLSTVDAFTVSYIDVPYCCGAQSPSSSFQAVLAPDGTIVLNYQRLQPGGAENPSIGFENHDGSHGGQLAYGWDDLPADESSFVIWRRRVQSAATPCQWCPPGWINTQPGQTSCTECPIGTERGTLTLPLEVGVATVGSNPLQIAYNGTYTQPLIILGVPSNHDELAVVYRVLTSPRQWCGSITAGQCEGQDGTISPCVWNLGDGIGRREDHIGESLVDEAACESLVRQNRPTANGASYKASTGSCYAEFGMGGHNGNPEWSTCMFAADSCADVGIDATPGCVDAGPAGMFEMYGDTPECDGDGHAVESVAWMIVEEGTSGALVAGHLHSKCAGTGALCVRSDGDKSAGQDWVREQFDSPIDNPVVISTIQTHTDVHWAKTRHRAVDGEGFQIRVEEAGTDLNHNQEVFGWIALPAGDGNLAGLTFAAIATPASVTSGSLAVSFRSDFRGVPFTFGSVSTFNSPDSVHLRQTVATTLTAAEVTIQEEQCLDGETYHGTGESVALLTIDMGQAADITQNSPACQLCPAGQHDHDSSAATDCVLCPVATYFAAAGGTNCTACPTGFSSSPGSTTGDSCYQLLDGMCAGNADSTANVLCPAGSELIQSAASVQGSDVQTCCTPCQSGSTSTAMVDPCVSTASASAGDTIGVTGGYEASAQCSWRIECNAGPVLLTFSRFYTEASIDFVEVLDARNLSNPELVAILSGSSLPSPQLSNSSTMLVQLTADASLQQDGFLANVDCPSDSATDRASQCKACPLGEYDDDSDSSTPCNACAPGRYSDSPGFAGTCSACPPGSTSLAVSSTSVDNCTTSCAAGIEIPDAVLELEFDTGTPQDVSGNGQPVLISSGHERYDDGFGAVRDE